MGRRRTGVPCGRHQQAAHLKYTNASSMCQRRRKYAGGDKAAAASASSWQPCTTKVAWHSLMVRTRHARLMPSCSAHANMPAPAAAHAPHPSTTQTAAAAPAPSGPHGSRPPGRGRPVAVARHAAAGGRAPANRRRRQVNHPGQDRPPPPACAAAAGGAHQGHRRAQRVLITSCPMQQLLGCLQGAAAGSREGGRLRAAVPAASPPTRCCVRHGRPPGACKALGSLAPGNEPAQRGCILHWVQPPADPCGPRMLAVAMML